MIRTSWIAIVAIIVIVLILAAVFFYIWLRSRNRELVLGVVSEAQANALERRVDNGMAAPALPPLPAGNGAGVVTVGGKGKKYPMKSHGNTAATYRQIFGKESQA